MKATARLLVLASVLGAAGACIQQVDGGAALDPGSPDASTASDPSTADASSWELCQSPSCDDLSGTIPFLSQTPVIYLPDGGSTTDPCVQVEEESAAIRQTYCASCHGASAGAGQGGFNYVLDDGQLTTNTTSSATFPRYVIPGNP